MAATVISSETVVLSGGSATITIPSDCTKVQVTWTFYVSTDASGLSTATLNSAAYDAASELPTSGSDSATGILIWNNPATGARTLAITWDAAPAEGPTIIVSYIKGAQSTWRDVDWDAASSTAAVTVTLSTVSGDLVIKHDQHWDSGDVPPGLTPGWTTLTTQGNNTEGARTSSITATGTTQVCASENLSWSTVVAVAWESSSVSALGSFRVPPHKLRPRAFAPGIAR